VSFGRRRERRLGPSSSYHALDSYLNRVPGVTVHSAREQTSVSPAAPSGTTRRGPAARRTEGDVELVAQRVARRPPVVTTIIFRGGSTNADDMLFPMTAASWPSRRAALVKAVETAETSVDKAREKLSKAEQALADFDLGIDMQEREHQQALAELRRDLKRAVDAGAIPRPARSRNGAGEDWVSFRADTPTGSGRVSDERPARALPAAPAERQSLAP